MNDNVKTERKTILTPFELTVEEREWLARHGNMAHALRRLIREDMERKGKPAATTTAERGE